MVDGWRGGGRMRDRMSEGVNFRCALAGVSFIPSLSYLIIGDVFLTIVAFPFEANVEPNFPSCLSHSYFIFEEQLSFVLKIFSMFFHYVIREFKRASFLRSLEMLTNRLE